MLTAVVLSVGPELINVEENEREANLYPYAGMFKTA